MIKAIDFRNYKNFSRAVTRLEPLTVFVGPNASGKSSILQAIDLGVRAAATDPDRVFVGNNRAEYLITKGKTEDLLISMNIGPASVDLHANYERVKSPLRSPDTEDMQWKWCVDPPEIATRSRVLQQLASIKYLRLDTHKIAAPSYSDQAQPTVTPEGTGLASVIAFLKLTDDPALDVIQDHMRELVPSFRKIRVGKAPVVRKESEIVRFGEESISREVSREYQGEALLFDFDNADSVPARNASDGTLMLLAFVTVLLGPGRPHVLLVDDIEHGLHPIAQKTLVDVLRKIMDKFSDLQVLATTHSPYLVDCLRPEEVRIVGRGNDGYSDIRPLQDHRDFGKWKDEMAPGEMWSMFGEQWVTQTRQ